MSCTLYIDTSESKIVRVKIFDGHKQIEKSSALSEKKAQMVLPLIEGMLTENKLSLKDITEIKVNTGPGSFTGLRVGITIANTLGMLLRVPVNGKQAGTIISAIYRDSKFDDK